MIPDFREAKIGKTENLQGDFSIDARQICVKIGYIARISKGDFELNARIG